MVRVRADLHTHSSSSDGTDTPSVLARKADAMELGGIALTDHDTLDGIQEFMQTMVSDELVRVPGLEISSEYENKEVHILGYFVPPDSKPLNEGLEFLRKSRHERLPKMIKKLTELGIDITIEELYEEIEGVASPGRPHVAQLLIKKGVVKTTSEAFQQYLAAGKPAYVKKDRLQTLEVVKLLRSAKAIPVLAHPLTIEVENLHSLLDRLVSAGLVGIEVEYDYSLMGIYHTSDELKEVIQNMNVIHTGGSDYHGTAHYTKLGSVTVPIATIDSLERVRSEL
jgi:predicted metal-dependent phosphoesterase TrpH